jgi:hypothetical protein
MILLAIGTFLSGAVYEATCVFWVHFSERGRPFKTGLFSMLAATAEVCGIGASVHDWWLAPFFIVGYGTGTVIAIKLKAWWLHEPSLTET